MTNDYKPRHTPEGVYYWDGNMGEYILDPSPDINIRPSEKFRTKEFKSNPVTTKEYG